MGSTLDLAQALEVTFEEINYADFYREIFPEGEFEKKGVLEEGKYNGIAVAVRKGEKHARRYTVTDDLAVVDELVATDDFCIMSPISYAGKSRKSVNARYMYALAIDLDGVETMDQWQFLMTQITEGEKMIQFVWGLPRPTYIISSGTGLHLYFVFEKPVPLFKNIVKQLEVLKRRLTWQAWTQGSSSLHDHVQYESLFQGFRVVGSITKNGGRCRAFKTGEKVTVEYLNKFVPEEYQIKSFAYKSKTNLSLAEAKKKYPDWYQKRVVEGRPQKTWQCKKDLYNWWIRKLKAGAEQGHRYWCIMTLATYAKKCGVSRQELEADAYGLIPFMNTRGDAFTEDDVMHAIEAYTDSYIMYPIHTIVTRTGIPIEKNKRNGRKQVQHLRLARGIRKVKGEMGELVSGGGRPQKSEVIKKWRREHPNGKPKECIAETGISKNTVYRWWNMTV